MFNTFEYTGKMWNDLVDSMGSGWVAKKDRDYSSANIYRVTHKSTGKFVEVELLEWADMLDNGVVYIPWACDCADDWDDDEPFTGCYCEDFALNDEWIVKVKILDGFADCGCCYADEDEEVDGFLNVDTREGFEMMVAALSVVSELPEVVAALLVDELETLEQWKSLAYRGKAVDMADADQVAALFEAVA